MAGFTVDFDNNSEAFELGSHDNTKEPKEVPVPLNTNWTFWIDKCQKGVSVVEYEANLQKVYTVSTVQSFWSVFHHIPDVKELKNQHSYHLMRGDRRPVWEDDVNRNGGSWRFKVSKHDSAKVWQELLMAAIGEQFEDCVCPGDNICGVSITVREKDDIIQIWNEDSTLYTNGVIQKVYELLPKTKFLAEFYRAHNAHRAYSTAA